MGKGGRDESDGSGSRDIVSLIMSPWRMETRLRAKASVDVFGRWPTRVRPHACHGDTLRREPLDIFHELSNRWEIRSLANQMHMRYRVCTSDACEISLCTQTYTLDQTILYYFNECCNGIASSQNM